MNVRICRDLEEAKILWQRHWPHNHLFDLWSVRACFQSQFNYAPYFLVAERNDKFSGMIALSWIDEERYFGHFPGEVWGGKTWLEQNRIVAADAEAFKTLIAHIPERSNIRYLTGLTPFQKDASIVFDETGYCFFPQDYAFSFPAYMASFSGKSRKKIAMEMDRLKAAGVTFRFDNLKDIDTMYQLNINAFKDCSYFSDSRFLKSFERLVSFLYENELLRVTTVLIGGRVAAVDLCAVWNATYTVLAGGTHTDFRGVAKLINLHHIEWACNKRFACVDFLCGDFNWKDRFHLTGTPLYKINNLFDTECKVLAG